MGKKIKTANIKEMMELGLLHEINRKFLHPLGLALAISIKEDGKSFSGEIWDYRDDPEGILFDTLDEDKIIKMEEFSKIQHAKREKEIGFIIQKGNKRE